MGVEPSHREKCGCSNAHIPHGCDTPGPYPELLTAVFFEKQQNLHTQSGKHGSYANIVLSTRTVISQSINQADCNLACDTLDSLVTVGAVRLRVQKLCEFTPVKMFSTLPLLVLISTIGNYFF